MVEKTKFYKWSKLERGKNTDYKISADNMGEKEAREIIADLIVRYNMDVDIDLEKLIRWKPKEEKD